MKHFIISSVLSGLALAAACQAEVRLPSIFSDHAVLQAGKPVTIWGWANPQETVEIIAASQSAKTTADENGNWKATLPALVADGPISLTVNGTSNAVVVKDVLVGEVWLCSGQSNMEMQLDGLHGGVIDAKAEVAAADHPTIRMYAFDETFDILKLPAPSDTPQDDRPGHWIVCSPQTAAQFTAIGYYVGRTLNSELKSPVGLINSSVGGTPIEAWTSVEKQKSIPELSPLLADWASKIKDYQPTAAQAKAADAKAAFQKQRADATAKGEAAPKAPAASVFKNLLVSKPGGLFNSMIKPIMPYTVRGVLWYQGERNANGPFTQLYGKQLQTLISDWRERWQDDFYFAYVQIAPFQKPQTLPSENKDWGVWVRDGQREALSTPKTGMAITTDLGGPDPIPGHPKNKADFADRLSRLVLHDVYGKPIEFYCGPVYHDMKVEGSQVRVSFDYAKGLHSKEELKGFAVAGADHNFVWATARVDGADIIVSSDAVKEPKAVRYGWAANPIGNLINGGGLPASPFRTDDWKD